MYDGIHKRLIFIEKWHYWFLFCFSYVKICFDRNDFYNNHATLWRSAARAIFYKRFCDTDRKVPIVYHFICQKYCHFSINLSLLILGHIYTQTWSFCIDQCHSSGRHFWKYPFDQLSPGLSPFKNSNNSHCGTKRN